MTPIATEVLNKAADLIEEEGWCQGAYAMTVDEVCTMYDDPEASRFCAMGAIHRAYGAILPGPIRAVILNALKPVIGTDSVAGWNDRPGQTREGVVRGLREAARIA